MTTRRLGWGLKCEFCQLFISNKIFPNRFVGVDFLNSRLCCLVKVLYSFDVRRFSNTVSGVNVILIYLWIRSFALNFSYWNLVWNHYCICLHGIDLNATNLILLLLQPVLALRPMPIIDIEEWRKLTRTHPDPEQSTKIQIAIKAIVLGTVKSLWIFKWAHRWNRQLSSQWYIRVQEKNSISIMCPILIAWIPASIAQWAHLNFL